MTRPTLLFVVTEDWYFLSHRLPMARAAKRLGFDVLVATHVDKGAAAIAAEGFQVIPLSWRRQASGPWQHLLSLLQLWRLYRRLRPSLIHHIALKPALFGSLAALFAGSGTVVNSVAGMGYAFIGQNLKARVLRIAMTQAFRLLFGRRNSWLVVQNQDDFDFFRRLGLAADRLVQIAGSGVDADVLRPQPEPPARLRATLVARMLWDKGVGEAVDAARLLARKGVPVTITLVGAPDPANPRSISEEQLMQWRAEGLVDWQGHRTDIAQVWAESAIAILPSYREGMPKALLEAAACGRPVVATDVPGCRELVRDSHNGLLVRPQDATSLADAIERLAGDPALRARLGAGARADVEARFASTVIERHIADLYRHLAGVACEHTEVQP